MGGGGERVEFIAGTARARGRMVGLWVEGGEVMCWPGMRVKIAFVRCPIQPAKSVTEGAPELCGAGIQRHAKR